MSLRQIDSKYFVAGQIAPEHVPQIVEAGFSAIVCIRPDGEGWGQPAYAEIEAAATAAGLKAYYLPVGGGMPMEQASKLKQVLRETEGKVLAYCASGARASMLYQMAKQAAA